MSSGGALNLSLLSRGVGEVSKNGHEKVDVIFEPQDYFNFVDSRRYYLPPIHSHVTFNTTHDHSARSSGRPVQEIYLPKTFTTRKGALLLFSEDLAHRTRQVDVKRQSHHKGSELEGTDISESSEDTDIKTVEDLTKSILSYGKQSGREREESDIYLKFVYSRRRDYFERQIRPGFSAKRYLSTWTKSWDDSILEKVISKGYLTEKSLFYYNPLLPHLSRRLNDDMSHYPAPYKLMRSMLMSPGSLSGYTFYKVRPESAETEIAEEDGRATRVSIKVLSTKDGVQKEVTYASLDRKGQEEVLTDLLVKSAVHYAIKKQQEYMEEYMDVGGPNQVPIPEFDMKNAVESLLETEQYVAPHGTAVLEPEFPEMDSRSQSSAYSGSFKGTRVKRKHSSHEKLEKGHSKAVQADRDERDDGVPMTNVHDMRSSFTSSIPQLPPVSYGQNLVLTPIGEASREHTQALSLPPVIRNGKDGEKIPAVNVQPPTPQHSTLSNLPTSRGMPRDPNLTTTAEMKDEEDDEDERWTVAVQEREYQQHLRRQREQDERRERKAKHRAKVAQQNIEYDAVSAEGKGMVPSGGSHLLSSSESLVGGSSQSTSSKVLPRPQGWKGSTQSLRSYGSRKGQDSRTAVTVSPHQSRTSSSLEQSTGSTAEEGSLKGSIIFGPDGEAILIGGKIAPTHKHHDPHHISEVHYANRHHTRDTSDESDAEVPDEWRTRQRIQSERLSEKLKKYAHKRDEEETGATPVENHRSEHAPSQPISIASSVVESPKSSVTEKEIVDALTEHAQKIAENILSSQDAGQNLEKDIRRAAELWMETHPVRHISRSQSVQEVANRTMIEEIMRTQKRNSAGPTVAEYRDEIKKNLVTAITKAAGMVEGSIPLDAEIDPELMQALANQTLTPEDIEIVKDENGRSIIRSRTRMNQTMGLVKEGHIYMPATQDNADQRKISIPADRASVMNIGEPDVIHYGGKPIHETASEKAVSDKSPSERHPSPQTVSDKVSEKAQSLKGKSPAQSLKEKSPAISGSVQGDGSSRKSGASGTTKSQVSFKGVESAGDDLAKALADMEKGAGSFSKEGASSLKSSKSGASLKSSEEKSKVSDKSSKKEEKREEFVVGLYDHMEENKKLYGMSSMVDKSTATEIPGRVDHTEENKRIYGVKSRKGKPKEKAKASAVKKPEGKKGGKKGKGKKKEKEVEEPPPKEPSPEPLESTPPPPKALTPKQPTPKSETPIEPEREETPVTVKSESEEEEDFIIVRDETYSPEPVVEPLQRVSSVTSHSSEDDETKAGQEEDESDQDLKTISNREARNAKRAAAAEKRRQEVERKRREREEQLKREKEEQERQEKMKQELEELRRKKEEERRLKKLQEEEESARELQEANELELRRQREIEREKRKKEEYAKKFEEMRKKQAEEEQRKAEEAERRRLEEEEERKREAEMLATMEEEERIEYERRKQLEEEERQKKEEEEKKRREEEAQRAMELARRLAEEMARKQAELEAKLRFNRTIQLESSGLDHTQDITRAFVFSYFELLQWLGLDIPEFALLKLNQY